MTPVEVEVCEALARDGAAGDEAAARALVFDHLWLPWERLIRTSRFMGRFRDADDHVHNVRERLAVKVLRTLHGYPAWQARNPHRTFADWSRIAVANVIRRYVRQQLQDPLVDPAQPGVEHLLHEFSHAPALERLGVRPPITAAQTAAELMAFADAHLPADQHAVLRLWLTGASAEEIAASLALRGPEAATRLQRAAVAMLRRAFRGPAAGDANKSDGAA